MQLFCASSLLRFEHMCIFVKGCLTFELEYILFRDIILFAGVNQTFSVTLLNTMIHLVVNEALLFNIFTRALYNVPFFFFLILH